MRGFAVVVAVVVAVALLLTGCSVKSGGEAMAGAPTWEFDVEDTDVLIDPGDSFVITVEDNASVGDDWSVSRMPDPAVVEAGGDDYVSDSGADVDGGGGKRYFRFHARNAGTTTIELRNCFRGCAEPGDDLRYPMVVKVAA